MPAGRGGQRRAKAVSSTGLVGGIDGGGRHGRFVLYAGWIDLLGESIPLMREKLKGCAGLERLRLFCPLFRLFCELAVTGRPLLARKVPNPVRECSTHASTPLQ